MVLPLTPRPGTNTYGRDAFQAHGDNAKGDASDGCIIIGPDTRRRMRDSGDPHLRVVP